MADGKTDDQTAIAQALAAAAAWTDQTPGNRAIVQFPPGAYSLARYRAIFAINLVGLHDITVTGDPTPDPAGSYPTKLIGAPPGYNATRNAPLYNSFFNIHGAQNIVIENFYLDKQTPYFLQGTVRDADTAANTIDLAVAPGYRDFADPYVAHLLNIIWFFNGPSHDIWDHGATACASPSPRLASDNGCYNTHILSRRLLSPNLWRLTLDEPPSPADVGHPFLIWKNLGWQPGVMIDHSRNVTIADIFYTGGGGPAVHIQFSDGDNIIKNVRVDIPPASDALFAATSGFNGGSNRGTITLDNVHVAHVDDDAFHFSAGPYYPVLDATPAGDHLRLALCYDGSFRPGDSVALWDWSEKREVSRARIVTSTIVQDSDAKTFPRTCDITLDHGLGVIHQMRSYNPNRLGMESDENDRLLNLSFHPQLTVENSYLSSMRARCGIIQVSATFTNNTCENTALAGLIVGPEFSWGEGYSVDHVAIENSIFRNLGGPAIIIGNIADSTRLPTFGQMAAPSASTNIARNNTAIDVTNNHFKNLGAFAYGTMGLRGAAVTVQNAENVTIAHNTLDPTPPRYSDTKTPIVIAPATTGNIVVRN